MSKQTTGPWTAVALPGNQYRVEASGRWVADIKSASRESRAANARLIAAAPLIDKGTP
jgi:hypothetical protein